jgi:hypothetical protein
LINLSILDEEYNHEAPRYVVFSTPFDTYPSFLQVAADLCTDWPHAQRHLTGAAVGRWR